MTEWCILIFPIFLIIFRSGTPPVHVYSTELPRPRTPNFLGARSTRAVNPAKNTKTWVNINSSGKMERKHILLKKISINYKPKPVFIYLGAEM